MTVLSGIILYLLIWWTTLFCVLPWGNKNNDSPELGHATSAPKNPRIQLKLWINTGIATTLFLLIYWAVDYTNFSWYDYIYGLNR
jgi:predicted secreted protein